MVWLNALIYFNDETDFVIWSKLYVNICTYKLLWKIVQKIYLIFAQCIFRPVPPKNIQLPIHVRINEYAHTWTTNTDFS